jgi:hypothetical protein
MSSFYRMLRVLIWASRWAALPLAVGRDIFVELPAVAVVLPALCSPSASTALLNVDSTLYIAVASLSRSLSHHLSL